MDDELAVIERVEVPRGVRAAHVQSVDEAHRTFEVVWTTGARAPMTGLVNGEWIEFDEELDMAGGNIDRLNNGGAVMDSHGRTDYRFGSSGLIDQVGVVLSAQLNETAGTATCQLLNHESEARTWAGLQQGIFRNVSFGYTVHRYENVTTPDDPRTVLRAVEWEAFEITLTPIGADPGAHVRSQNHPQTRTVQVRAQGNTEEIMDEELEGQEASAGTGTATPAAAAATPAAGDPPTPATPTAVADPEPAAAAGEPEPVVAGAAPADDAEGRSIRSQERQRAAGILTAGRSLGLAAADLDALIADPAVTLEVAHGRMINLRAAADQRGGNITPQSSVQSVQERGNFRAAATEALNHRVGNLQPAEGQRTVQLSEEASRFRGMSLMRLGEEMLVLRGENVRGMDAHQLATRALHTSSDFASILANVSNLSLQRGYENQDQNWRQLATQANAPDFKDINMADLGDAPRLLKVPEHGEYKLGTIGEGNEKWALATYGRRFGLSRVAMINDSLGAFGRLPRMFGMAAAGLENDTMWSLITTAGGLGVTMADGDTLFHANHANTGTGAVTEANMQARRAAMRLQTTRDGNTMVVIPRFLIVPPALEMVALKEVAVVSPTATTGVNTFQGAFRAVLVEPRLETQNNGVEWYMAAEAAQVEGMVFSYLEGSEGPRIESRQGWEVDGIEFKASLDFAGHFINHRGWQHSTGV